MRDELDVVMEELEEEGFEPEVCGVLMKASRM